MLIAFLAGTLGLALLVWSAGVFIDGSAALARYFGMSPLLIGMLIVGFGTSAPEMLVSVMAAAANNSGIALGNVFGSNISNIALILGLTALISPITVHSNVVRKELPVLIIVTAVAAGMLWDGTVSRIDGLLLLAIFSGLAIKSISDDRKCEADHFSEELAQQLDAHPLPVSRAFLAVGIGLLVLILS